MNLFTKISDMGKEITRMTASVGGIILICVTGLIIITHGCAGGGGPAASPAPPIEIPSSVWIVNSGAKSTATAAAGEASFRLADLDAMIVQTFAKDAPQVQLVQGFPKCDTDESCQDLEFFIGQPMCHKDNGNSSGFCTIACQAGDSDGDGLDDDCVMFGGAVCIDGVCRAPSDATIAKPCDAMTGNFAACSEGNHTVLSCFNHMTPVNERSLTEKECEGSADPECAGPFDCAKDEVTLIIRYDQCVPQDNLGVVVNSTGDPLSLTGIFQAFVQINPLCKRSFAPDVCTVENPTSCTPCANDDECLAAGDTDPKVRCAVLDGVGTCSGTGMPCRVTDDCIDLGVECEPPAGAIKLCSRQATLMEEIKTADIFGMGMEDSNGQTHPFDFKAKQSTGTLSMDFGPQGYALVNSDLLDRLIIRIGGNFDVNYDYNEQKRLIDVACKVCLVSSVEAKHCCCGSADTTVMSEDEACLIYNSYQTADDQLISCSLSEVGKPDFDPCSNPAFNN